ncbi:VWA domain-containing protein [Candidatus Bipolaricaulota bacterium]|nr:VWA domain-containing protein [Candidatus Bipolaricaulota bacterium]
MIRFLTPYLLLCLAPILAASLYLVLRKGRYAILRTLILTLAILAAASPFRAHDTLSHNVFFLVDRSASVTLATDDDDVRSQIQTLMDDSPSTHYGLIEFAATSIVSAPLGMSNLPLGLATLDDSETNLHAAMELALSIMPVEESNQLVLISDGTFTDLTDRALSLVELAGVSVSVLPVGGGIPSDVSLAKLSAPDRVQIGRPFNIDIGISAQQQSAVRLIVYRDDNIVSMQDLEVSSGITEVTVSDEMDHLGSSVYQAIVKGANDPIPANDDLSVLVSSTEIPSVLVVDPLETSRVSVLLDSLGISYNAARAIPSLEVLADYRQLILASGRLEDYTLTEIETLEHFTRQLGGGVLLLAGEQEARGFSHGGIQELLPVTFDVPEKTEEASLAIVYLLDTSASMRERVDGVEKLDVLKEAAIASINLLDEEAMVGILAFDREREWVLPIATVDFTAVIEALQPMNAIGGTDIYFPIVDALDHLDPLEVRSKHVLLISDGKAGDDVRDYPGLVRRLTETEDTTLSAIAVGNSPNTTLLGTLVTAGGGTIYLANDFSSLPQVLIRATQRLSRERFVTGDTEVNGRLIDTHATVPVPPLQGYVVTYPKETTQTLLWAGEDPVVATWRVGLGSITVLAADLNGTWTRQWFEWVDMPRFFDGILATMQSDTNAALGLSATVSFEGSTTSIVVDARDADGGYVNFLDIEAKVLPTNVTLQLTQVSPGLYQERFPTPAKGGYTIQILDQSRDRSLNISLTVPYSAEVARIDQDLATLHWIAEHSDGVVLGPGVGLPQTEERVTSQTDPLHGLFILLALILFLLELIIRKWPVSKKSQRAAE